MEHRRWSLQGRMNLINGLDRPWPGGSPLERWERTVGVVDDWVGDARNVPGNGAPAQRDMPRHHTPSSALSYLTAPQSLT